MRKLQQHSKLLILLLVGIFILAGCGTGGGTNEGANQGTGSETEQPSQGENGNEGAKETVYLGISQFVEHPALDATKQGILDALADNGYKDGELLDVDFRTSQANFDTALSIAQKFVGDQRDIIVAIATPSAQAAVQAADGNIPVVFAAVTDPVAAGLVESNEAPGGMVTGTSDQVPMDQQVGLIKKFIPDVQTIGVIYSSAEVNSNVQVDAVTAAAGKLGIEVVKAGITTGSEVQQGTQSLVGKVDAIFIPTDNTVVSAFEGVLKVAQDNGIPIFASDVDTVERGAVATYGMDYYQMGYQTGEIVFQIINGEDPSNIPVQTSNEIDLVINLDAASKFGLEVSDDLKNEAKELFGE